MSRLKEALRYNNNSKRAVSAIAISAMLMVCMVINQTIGINQPSLGTKAPPTVVAVGWSPYWDVVGSMIFYRNSSEAGNQSYWVAQSFQVRKSSPSSLILGLVIYVWLTRDIPPNSSFQGTADNITVLLMKLNNGTPDIDNPVANQTISPQNISAEGPYPQGLMERNDSAAVRLSFDALAGFQEGNYSIFLYRKDLGDHNDYHIGYAYYWAASKLDLYYGGGSLVLNDKGEWKSYPNDMCFLLFEITLP